MNKLTHFFERHFSEFVEIFLGVAKNYFLAYLFWCAVDNMFDTSLWWMDIAIIPYWIITDMFDYNIFVSLTAHLLKANIIAFFYEIYWFLHEISIGSVIFSFISLFLGFFNNKPFSFLISNLFFDIYWSSIYLNILYNVENSADIYIYLYQFEFEDIEELSIFHQITSLFVVLLDFVFFFSFDVYYWWAYICFYYDVNFIINVISLLCNFHIMAVIFLFAPILSLIFLSYLSLYGVLIFNLIIFVFFWFTVIIQFENFFFDNQHMHLVIGSWFTLLGYDSVIFEFYIDVLSYSYILLTLTIAVFVYIYTFSYFRYEPNVERLMIFIHLFVVSMLVLVSSGNFFVLFLGWELIGLTSFFLINFWSTRIATLKSAFKAFVFNKFSDVSFFIFILVAFNCVHDTSMVVFNTQIPMYQTHVVKFLWWELSAIESLSFFLLSAAFIKSAQFGVHIWLPDSMEAPVPASALIHSATLVSAGVFLVLRFNPLLELSIYAYNIVLIVGSFTAFFGACGAMFQSDSKRILAYSTISHCGFLMVTTAVRIPELTVFYLYVHGFFKASIFLCIGNIIRFNLNLQDFRRMGGFAKYLPFECLMVFICLVNLSGLPFSLGFLIKHVLLAFIDYKGVTGYWVVVNVLSGAVFGLIYSYRLYYYVFFDFKKNKKHIYNQTNREDLSSVYYSNTTLASNTAIMILTFVGYLISLFLYICFFTKYSLSDSIDTVFKSSSYYYNLHWSSIYFLNFLSQLNWIVLQIIFVLIYSIWRRVYNYYMILDSAVYLILFLIFSFLSLNFLLLFV